jgi:hypothetical protein
MGILHIKVGSFSLGFRDLSRFEMFEVGFEISVTKPIRNLLLEWKFSEI